MKRIDKLLEVLDPIIPGITEEHIFNNLVGHCENCALNDYCNKYFYLYEDGEHVYDEDGDPMVNPDMDCEDIVNQWLHEDCE